MRDFLFSLKLDSDSTLQTQLRRQLVAAIENRQLLPGQPVPSSRRLAKQLSVARNTIMLAYQALVEQGLLESRERSGFYVTENLNLPATPRAVDPAYADEEPVAGIDWDRRMARRPSIQRIVTKPLDWPSYRYPFIYGQIDPTLFPLAAWRECSRQALAKLAVSQWSIDNVMVDDALLLEQLRTRVLPSRGVRASDDEILITMGAQNALSLLSSLLFRRGVHVGMENPGYVDAFNIFALRVGAIDLLEVDSSGLVLGPALSHCDYVYVTPSHQSPTTVTMPLERRLALLEQAEQDDFIIIEDDYEGEMNFVGSPTPSLKSLDRTGRVVYIGSLSKSFAPGLRLGYLVASTRLIEEARLLRRLVLRHPPTNNQLTAALFLADGHFTSHLNRLHRVYRERWQIMRDALEQHLPHAASAPTFGGTSFWVTGPADLDAESLARDALNAGLIIEPGSIFFLGQDRPANHFRLGFSAIPSDRIEPGIRLLADLIRAKRDP